VSSSGIFLIVGVALSVAIAAAFVLDAWAQWSVENDVAKCNQSGGRFEVVPGPYIGNVMPWMGGQRILVEVCRKPEGGLVP
jgi:hypothetical protein